MAEGYGLKIKIWYAAKKLWDRVSGTDRTVRELALRSTPQVSNIDNRIFCSYCRAEYNSSLIYEMSKCERDRRPPQEFKSEISHGTAQTWFYNYYPYIECVKCKRSCQSCYTVKLNNVVVTLLF